MENLNIQHADCLKSATNWAETLVTNICTGAVTSVPHGSLDMVFYTGLAFGGVAFGLFFLSMAFAIIFG